MVQYQHLATQIGKNIRKIRQTRSLSLDKLAELTGVSKAMLGQIERGESNPTVTTLWKIANGLKVSFSSLIEEEKVSIYTVEKEKTKPIIERNGDYRVYPIFPFEHGKQFECFSIEIEPRTEHTSEAHIHGVEEYLIVTNGTLTVEINNDQYVLKEGDAIHFPADQDHSYRNTTPEQVKCVIFITYLSS